MSACGSNNNCNNSKTHCKQVLALLTSILSWPPFSTPHHCQAIAVAKRPHVIVGTPGRVVDHLSNTKGFSLKALKHLVLDEADKLLDMDFEQEIDQILKVGEDGICQSR